MSEYIQKGLFDDIEEIEDSVVPVNGNAVADEKVEGPSDGKKLFIIDGYGIIYRSYFAFISRPLTDGQGRNVSAVFGFFNTLLMIISKYKPEYLCVAMDSHGKTFRHEMFPEYKANRDRAPEDLHAQVPMILDVLKAVGIPHRQQVGMEADDIIATLCREAEKSNLHSVVVTGDKDLMQLVNDDVNVLRPPRKGEKEYMMCTSAEVSEIYGVRPDQIVDYLTMIGDSSDNVPGIDGIGPKGAERILSKYGTLEEAYSHLDEMTPAVRSKLTFAVDHVKLSHDLILLKNDLFEVKDFDAEGFGSLNLDWASAVPLFVQMNFKSLVSLAGKLGNKQSFDSASAAKAEVPVSNQVSNQLVEDGFSVRMSDHPDYQAVLTLDQLDQALMEAVSGGVVALDTETTSIDEMEADLVGFSFCSQVGKAWYVPLVCEGRRMMEQKPVLDILKRRLEGIGVVGQNLKYDYNVLRRAGVVLGRLHFDTMIAAWLLSSDSGVYNMDDLASRYLEYDTVKFEDVVPKDKLFSDISLNDSVRYGAEDSDVTWALYKLFEHKMEKAGLMKIFNEMEMPLVKTIADMEFNGICLDKDRIAGLSATLDEERVENEKKIFELCGNEFNLNSPKQLQQVLFVDRNLPTGKKTRSGFSTDSDVLQNLAASTDDPVPELVLRSRFLTKLRGYCEGLPPLVNPHSGRIHPSFLQTGTGTGRLSCKSPNLQNIPIRSEEGRMIRSAFPASEGCLLLSADYSQIELVVLAHYSQDPSLLDAFRSGDDVHKRTASLIFGQLPELVTPDQRRIAKTINFGVIYGMSAFRLSNELGISRRDAQGFIDSYFQTYRGVADFIQRTQDQAANDLSIRTMFGHVRLIPQMASSNKVELAGAQRIAVNSIIQGTAAEIMKKAMIGIGLKLEESGLKAKMLLQVHDERIFEAPLEEVEDVTSMVEYQMTHAASLSVPLRCSIETGSDWGKMH